MEFTGNSSMSFQVAGGPVDISDIDLSTGVGQCSIAPEPKPDRPVIKPPVAPAAPAKAAPVVTGLPNTGTGEAPAESMAPMLVVGATIAAMGVSLVIRRQHAD